LADAKPAELLAKLTKFTSHFAGRGRVMPAKIHAPARNKPFGAGASHFGMP
jgi:hypothetical protein